MKKFLTIAATAVMAVCLFVLSACGGATSTLSSFVSAVKKGDYEDASQYVVGQPALSGMTLDSDFPFSYMWDQTIGSFKYSVEETNINDDKTTATITITYSFYSYDQLMECISKNIFSNAGLITQTELSRLSKSDIKAQIKEMDKVKGTASIALVTNDDGDWLLSETSATDLISIMCSYSG